MALAAHAATEATPSPSPQGLRMNKEHAESLAKEGTAGGT
jgi:hypothetical protein